MLVCACGSDSGSGPEKEWRTKVTLNHYDRGIAFFAVDGEVTKAEIEIEGRRLPFAVGAAELVRRSESVNNLIRALSPSVRVTNPVLPTYEIAEGGVYLIDSTRELVHDEVFLIISYR